MNKNYIEKIREALEGLNNAPLFSDKEEDLELACADYLQSEGFTIVAPNSEKVKKFETVDMLIDFFYTFCGLKLVTEEPHNIKIFIADRKLDRKIAENFVKSIMETSNCDKESALQECGEIVKTVVLNIHLFNFDVPLSFYIFSQKFYWVTQKAIDIVNRKGINDESKN